MIDRENINNIIQEQPPANKLDREDTVRIIKGLLLIFLFWSVVVSSMIYYNAPNYNPNLVFEGVHDEGVKHDRHLHENPVYRLQSRYSSGNCKNKNKKNIKWDLIIFIFLKIFKFDKFFQKFL